MSKLALLGGLPTVSQPKPHFIWPPVTDDDKQAVMNQLDTGELSVYGRSGIIKEFEDEFAEYHKMTYAIATNSGTTALHSAFFGCGIGPGDEVLAPTYTFLATVTPILHVQAIPILVDADPLTGNIDVNDLKRKVNQRTKAIVITHMWGHPNKMDEILAIAKQHKLDTLIWLDTKLHISLYRTAKRMVLNRITNKRLWHGNKESLLRFITNFCPYIICSYKEHHRSSLVLQEELQQKSNTICIRTSSSSIKSLIEQTHSAE